MIFIYFVFNWPVVFEDICIYINKWYWSVIFFHVMSLVWYQNNVGLREWINNSSPFFILEVVIGWGFFHPPPLCQSVNILNMLSHCLWTSRFGWKISSESYCVSFARDASPFLLPRSLFIPSSFTYRLWFVAVCVSVAVFLNCVFTEFLDSWSLVF